MGFEPKKPDNRIKCPLKFAYPEIEQNCIANKCAWWMIVQKACAVNVNARAYGYIQKRE